VCVKTNGLGDKAVNNTTIHIKQMVFIRLTQKNDMFPPLEATIRFLSKRALWVVT